MANLDCLDSDWIYKNNRTETVLVSDQPTEPAFLKELKLKAKSYRRQQTSRKQTKKEEKQRMENSQKKEEEQKEEIMKRLQRISFSNTSAKLEANNVPSQDCTKDHQPNKKDWIQNKTPAASRHRAGDLTKVKRREHFFKMGPLQDELDGYVTEFCSNSKYATRRRDEPDGYVTDFCSNSKYATRRRDEPDGYVTDFCSNSKYATSRRYHTCQNWFKEHTDGSLMEPHEKLASKNPTVSRSRLSQMQHRDGNSLRNHSSLANFQMCYPFQCGDNLDQKPKKTDLVPANQSAELTGEGNPDRDESRSRSRERRRAFRERHDFISRASNSNKCCRCGKPVYMAEERRAAGKTYHKGCFSCFSCRRFLNSCNLKEKNEEIYCKSCCFIYVSSNEE